MNTELFGEKNRVLYRPVEVGCYGLVRVDGVAVTAERAYFKALSATVDLKVLRADGSASRVSGSAWELPG